MSFDKNFKNWLITNKMLINKNSDREKTHNTMEFGNFLSIKPAFYEQFMHKLVETLNKDKVNYLLEIRTDYFKYMVDVDFKNEYGLTEEEKINLLKLIHEAVGDCIKNQQRNLMIVSSCEDQKINVEGQDMIKIGFHLIWPNVIVGVEEALFLRSAIIQYLENSDITLTSLDDWETIIDISIYDEKHALRMNGSSKNVKCSICKGKKSRNICEPCRRTGWVNVGRIYKPYLIYDENNTLNYDLLKELQNDMYKNLTMTGIRTDEIKANIKKKFPEWFSRLKYDGHTKRKKRKKKQKFHTNPSTTIKNGEREEISEHDIRYKKLRKFLSSELFKLSSHFEDIEYDKLLKITRGVKQKNCSYIFATKCHYCLNTEKEHSSNHIYFVINKNSFYQKCLSPWKNKLGEKCEEFQSRHLPINTELRDILFLNKLPTEIKKPKIKPKMRQKLVFTFT